MEYTFPQCNIIFNNRIQLVDVNGDDPDFISGYEGVVTVYKFVPGFLRWARVQRGSNFSNGWVICDSQGSTLKYSQSSSYTGSILVNASGSYMVA